MIHRLPGINSFQTGSQTHWVIKEKKPLVLEKEDRKAELCKASPLKTPPLKNLEVTLRANHQSNAPNPLLSFLALTLRAPTICFLTAGIIKPSVVPSFPRPVDFHTSVLLSTPSLPTNPCYGVLAPFPFLAPQD